MSHERPSRRTPGIGRLMAATALLASSGLHLWIASNTRNDALALLVGLSWVLGITGLIASLSVAVGWRVGLVLSLVFVTGTLVWAVVFVDAFSGSFEELGDRPRPTSGLTG